MLSLKLGNTCASLKPGTSDVQGVKCCCLARQISMYYFTQLPEAVRHMCIAQINHDVRDFPARSRLSTPDVLLCTVRYPLWSRVPELRGYRPRNYQCEDTDPSIQKVTGRIEAHVPERLRMNVGPTCLMCSTARVYVVLFTTNVRPKWSTKFGPCTQPTITELADSSIASLAWTSRHALVHLFHRELSGGAVELSDNWTSNTISCAAYPAIPVCPAKGPVHLVFEERRSQVKAKRQLPLSDAR